LITLISGSVMDVGSKSLLSLKRSGAIIMPPGIDGGKVGDLVSTTKGCSTEPDGGFYVDSYMESIQGNLSSSGLVSVTGKDIKRG